VRGDCQGGQRGGAEAEERHVSDAQPADNNLLTYGLPHTITLTGTARIALSGIHQHGYRAYEAGDLEGNRWTFAQARPTK
jgi:hypothetical protein